MERLHKAHAHAAAKVDGAAWVAGLDLRSALAGDIHRKLIDRDKRRARVFADGGRVADMVVMAVRQHHMRRAARRFFD